MIKRLQDKNFSYLSIYTNHHRRGFTLIEIILYLAILSTFVFGLGAFVNLLTVSRVKNQAMVEVQMQSLQIMQTITQEIHNANSVTYPTIGQSQDSMTVVDSNNNTIIFAPISGVLTVNRGTGIVNLNNNNVEVDSIIFKNLSRVGTPSIIQITLTLKYKNISGSQAYDYVKTYVASAKLYK